MSTPATLSGPQGWTKRFSGRASGLERRALADLGAGDEVAARDTRRGRCVGDADQVLADRVQRDPDRERRGHVRDRDQVLSDRVAEVAERGVPDDERGGVLDELQVLADEAVADDVDRERRER